MLILIGWDWPAYYPPLMPTRTTGRVVKTYGGRSVHPARCRRPCRCPDGTYVVDNKCVQCSICAAGKVETDICTATNNTACLDCMNDASGTLLGTLFTS